MRGKAAVRFRPGDPLIEIHQVTLVDARGSRIDDDEHLGGEVLAAAVKDDAGDLDVLRVLRMRALVELQGGEAVLSVDDEKLILRLPQPADAAVVIPRLEVELLRGEQQDRSGNGGLGDGGLVK